MRDIKFRAWDKNRNIMFKVISLDMDDSQRYPRRVEDGEPLRFIEADNCILMQYTGLKDDNEKDIYEGDIVIPTVLGEKQGKWVVSYSEERARYIIRDIANKDIEEDIDNFCSYQVIGNIYENPELLEPEE